MRPGTLGRALGIGVRLFAQRVQPAPRPAPTPEELRMRSQRRVAQGARAGQGARRVTEGGRRFGREVWNPFAHAGKTLWLEVTGFFFLLFAAFFAQHMWMARSGYRTGAEHQHFIAYGVCAALFTWFAVSSFARARAIGRRRRAERAHQDA